MSAKSIKWKDRLKERAYEIHPYASLDELCENAHKPVERLALYNIMLNGGEVFSPPLLAPYVSLTVNQLRTIYRTRGRGTKYS
jgi:hypothetical protein